MARSVDRVRSALAEHGISARIHDVAESTRTARQAADVLDVCVGQIAKSLVFRGADTDQALLVIAAGDRRVCEARLAALAGEPIRRADAAFVREWTGFTIGGIPPLAHRRAMRTWLDDSLRRFEVVWAAAGSPFAVFPVPTASLPELTGAPFVPVQD